MGPREQAGFLREAFDILKTTVQKWLDDKASRLAAALSFYTILSLAPEGYKNPELARSSSNIG